MIDRSQLVKKKVFTVSITEDATRREFLAKNRWIMALIGILAIIAGLFAIVRPFASGLAITDVFGVILIVGAAIHLVHTIWTRESLWSVVFGVIVSFLYAIAGIYLLTYSLAGLFTLTVVLGTLYTIVGLYRIATSLEAIGHAGWGWALVGGVLTLILGIWILAALPTSLVWALGLVIGVDLIFFGVSLLSAYTVLHRITTTGTRFAENM